MRTTARFATGLTIAALGLFGLAPSANSEGLTVTRDCLVPAAAISGVTERLQMARYTVIAVDAGGHRVRVMTDAGAAWDLACRPGMVRADSRAGGVTMLGAGDIVSVPSTGTGGVALLRRAWQELASPER